MLVLFVLTFFVTCVISEPVDIPIGTIINIKYRVLEKIHNGSHATVYKVIEKTAIWTTDKIWAMKIQRTYHYEKRLSDEYDFYNRLKCTDPSRKPPGLPLVYECSKYGAYEYFILEYFEQRLVDQELSQFEALKAIVQVIGILEYIHRQKVIHCNIKRENMMLRGNVIVLIDFADAQIYLVESTRTGKFVGKPEVAPLRAHSLLNQDQECDLESLGYVVMIILGVPMPFDKTDIDYETKKHSFLGKGIKQRNFKNGPISGLFTTYFTYLLELNFGDTPQYEILRNIFEKKLKKMEKTKPKYPAIKS